MLEIRPTHLKPAREFVGKYHRHNIPPVGGKFAISCFERSGTHEGQQKRLAVPEGT